MVCDSPARFKELRAGPNHMFCSHMCAHNYHEINNIARQLGYRVYLTTAEGRVNARQTIKLAKSKKDITILRDIEDAAEFLARKPSDHQSDYQNIARKAQLKISKLNKRRG